jgi:hypothetical protein
MYYTGIDPDSGKTVYVPRTDREKGLQKALILWHQPGDRNKVLEALRELGREDLEIELLGEAGRRRNEKKTAESSTLSHRPGLKHQAMTKKRH